MLKSFTRAVFALAGIVVLSGGSCIAVVDTPPSNNNGGGGSDKITVKFINLTAFALDPLFYASSEPVTDPALLFTPSNQVVEGIGFAGRGTIPAGEPDEVTLDCDSAVTIGTRGGQFLNQDSGAVAGTGQQRIANRGVLYECGDTITITYSSQGGGFSTGLAVE